MLIKKKKKLLGHSIYLDKMSNDISTR